MPIMDGYEASKNYRDMIDVQGAVGNSDKDICFKNGMDYFLAKPLKKHRFYGKWK